MKHLSEIFKVFFKLGCFAFGGPAAHIALMDSEIVQKRKWLTSQEFLDLIGATNIIPGPNSTEMTMHCGYVRGGRIGLFVAGISFIFPAVVITAILAYLYVNYGELPNVKPWVQGITPAVLAVIAAAVFKLGKKALKNWELGVIGALVLIAALLGMHEIIALLIGGIVGMLYFYFKNQVSQNNDPKLNSSIFLLAIPSGLKLTLSTSSIFFTFLKVGSILYGSGYVLFAYLKPELVDTGLLTMPELTDAIGVGQFTPGPVLSTATFIGYQLGTLKGALAATAGIFLPSFIFVLIFHKYMLKMRKIKLLSYFLDAVNVSALAVMVAVLMTMAYSSLVISTEPMKLNVSGIIIAAAAVGYTFFTKKPNPIYTIIGGALLGYLLHFTM